MSRYILGVHSGHDSSACLIKDNKIIYAIQKERITRKKHDFGEPIECIEYILDDEKISPKNIDLLVRCNWHDAMYLNDEYYKKFPNVIVNLNHHIFHAWAITSIIPYNLPTIIWVIDGRGCRIEDVYGKNKSDKNLYEAESIYLARKGSLIPLEKRFSEYRKNEFSFGNHIDTIGYAYAHVAKAIFKSSHDAGKVMALAALGTEDDSIPPVFNFYSHDKLINENWLRFLDALPHLSWNSHQAKNLSFSIQRALEEYTTLKIHLMVQKYGYKNVAICGGVGLNCKNNGLIANSSDVNSLFLFPACDDSGLSVGAAIWALRNIFNDRSIITYKPFLGKKYFHIDYDDKIILNVAELLAYGNIVALFQGESEFGPRALGHRSILCPATNIKFKVELNNKIKKRESFRPFGGVILYKNLKFVTSDKIASDYMLSAVNVNSKISEKYPALVHKDGTVRLQIIRDDASVVGKILRCYEQLTGNILLINTSFNGHEEPIVETQNEAIACAKKNSVRYVFCDGKLMDVFNYNDI